MFLKKYFILIITLLCFVPLKSQSIYEPVISLFFEDNAGRKDTITFGLNDTATVDIDTAFNEVDIYGTPYDSLDIRIILFHRFTHHTIFPSSGLFFKFV